ncbi:hypothetical protein HZS55_04235 [Halosimplex rubrum]|uniref:Uncharacterized protein n=1 Tax=Halosimplex rubrum TaxID=869889 RepID=A0A7D5P7S0_9EURY|nr:hypothetical protein [Halosimplex rubrum]QLH76560.1 hypothetical protein HZS55_04235 [Halosimplex rubrum]
MSRRLRVAGVAVGLACLALALATGGAAGQDEADNESVGSLVDDAGNATLALERASDLRDDRFRHIGSGGTVGLGLGLVVGSIASFGLWRARLR